MFFILRYFRPGLLTAGSTNFGFCALYSYFIVTWAQGYIPTPKKYWREFYRNIPLGRYMSISCGKYLDRTLGKFPPLCGPHLWRLLMSWGLAEKKCKTQNEKRNRKTNLIDIIICNYTLPKFWRHNKVILTRAGTSPSVWTHGLAFLGLAGTRGLASPIEDLPLQHFVKLLNTSRISNGTNSPRLALLYRQNFGRV